MRKAKLIGEEATWQQLNYSRCGRTDKGVSAAGQVNPDFPPVFVHGFSSFVLLSCKMQLLPCCFCPVMKPHIKPASMHMQAMLQSAAPARKQ